MILFESKIQSPVGMISILCDSEKAIGLFFGKSELEDWLSVNKNFRGARLQWGSENSLNKKVFQQLNLPPHFYIFFVG